MGRVPLGIVDTGVANLASLRAAFERLGLEPASIETPRLVEACDHLVLPGVGAFGAAAERLQSLGLVDALRDRIDSGRPALCVCLGMQLLFESSEESPGAAGLGVVAGGITRLADAPRRTHFGWSQTTPDDASDTVLSPGYAYFAHSFCACDAPPGWSVARAAYGRSFLAAMRRGRVLACQFHPELSGAWGLSLLARWLRREPRSAASCSLEETVA